MNIVHVLRQFLIASNKAGYASAKESEWKKEKDHSTTITFTKGEWSMHDNFFGGEPYGGRLIVYYKQKPFWIMVYYGSIVESFTEVNELYAVLREALKRMPKDAPFRGPKVYRQKDFVYKNSWTGTLEKYEGKEFILGGKEHIYEASYMGGLVDLREGV